MGGFCGGGGAAAPKTKQEKNSEANKQAAGTRMAAKGDYKSPKTGFQQVKDDIQMDLGIKPKDVDYYARVDDRAARSKAAMENIGKDIFGRPASDRSSSAPAAPAAPKPPAPVAEAPEVPKPPTGTTTIVPRPRPDQEGVGIGTAASGEAEAAEIEATAEGEAETKVADTARKGRRSQIATSAKGLLSEAPTRKRRSLMSGLIA
jgi:hypothetical protein